jgi:hypothetical protein
MRTVLAAVSLLLAACARDFTLDEATLAAAARDVVPDVETETGTDLSGLTIRIGTRDDLVRTLVAELTEQLTVPLADEATARTRARACAIRLSRELFAKYSYAERVVLACEENLRPLAVRCGEPLILTPEGVRAILAHECVHAADDRRYGLRAGLAGAGTLEALEARSAVLEGHAQLLARRICERRGWGEAFEAFTRSLDGAGEAFMRFVEEEGGAAAVERALRSPPAELALVARPRWFLDPASRPEPEFDLSAALRRLVARHPPRKWSAVERSPGRSDMREALSLLPVPDVDWVVETVEESRSLRLTPRRGPRSTTILAALHRFSSREDAERCLGLLRRLHRLKDETMRTGTVRIEVASYHETAVDGRVGEVAAKTIRIGKREVRAATLTVRAGTFVLEVARTGDGIDQRRMIETAIDVLTGVDS